jgi:serine/threonine-protein kinase
MTDAAARLRRVRELFDAAMDRPADARAAFLAEAAGTDTALRHEVLELLTITAATSGPLATALAHTSDDRDERGGERLGPYELVRLVGQGGMGTVYEAVRADDQYRKRVAIKLVRTSVATDLTLARFRRERQILATLEHKNIATLLDGGVAPDGRPFLVMEFVEGEPITRWCDERRLPLRERLALLRQVCAAVQHAHFKLVIHRDLKPGNMLVTSDGTVKLLDFGIAKLLDDTEGGDDAPLTRAGTRTLTPEYASPEQLRGDPLGTTSDVYSLGVVLYELLTGRRPHVSANHSLAELERLVLEEAVARPSSAVSNEAAAQRGERSAERLRRHLQGDLDAIALMALRQEPARRFQSASALGEDIRRWLDGLPVAARPDSPLYRTGKFVRRHAVAVAASLLVVLALVGGVISTTIEARRARTAQLRTERVNGFLASLLSSVKPTTGGPGATVAEVLDSAAKRMVTELADEPDVRADLESVIGTSYLSLGREAEALEHLQAELALARSVDGPRGARVANALNNVGYAYLTVGKLDLADSLVRAALAMKQSLHAPVDTTLAAIYGNLGSIAHAKGNNRESEQWHREALAAKLFLDGPAADDVARSMQNVAVTLGDQDRWAAAESLQRQALAIVQQNHREPTDLQAAILTNLATGLDLQGNATAADSAYRNVLELRRRLLGPRHPDYALTLYNYSGFLIDQHRYAEAEAMSREILELRGTAIEDTHPMVAAALQTLGRCLDQRGDHAGAVSALEESLALRRRALPSGSWLIASSEGVLGEHFTLVHDYRAAEPLLLGADSTLQRVFGNQSPRTQANVKRVVALYVAWNKPDAATTWRARLTVQPPH